MSWAAVAVGAGSAISGMMGSSGAKKAAKQQAAAMREATALQKRIHEETRSDLSGYRDLGQEGIKGISGQMDEHTKTFGAGDMQKDAGYNFRMAEGQKALERGAASRGRGAGGRAMKEIARYGQGFASNEYNNAYNRFNQDRDQRYGKIMDLVGTGQNAAAKTGSLAQNYANQAGNAIMSGGNAQGAASIAGGNAWGNALQQGIGAYASMPAGGGTNADGVARSDAYVQGIKDSDRRLKKDIEEMNFSIFKEVPTYLYKYIDPHYGKGLQVGTMAQDLLAVDANHPAVSSHDGYYRVDYSKVERV